MANPTDLLHDRNRLAIISLLAVSETGSMPFNEIQERASLTPGNLSSHLKTLESNGMVVISKMFVDRKPLTTVSLSETGRTALYDFIAAMETLIQRLRNV